MISSVENMPMLSKLYESFIECIASLSYFNSDLLKISIYSEEEVIQSYLCSGNADLKTKLHRLLSFLDDKTSQQYTIAIQINYVIGTHIVESILYNIERKINLSEDSWQYIATLQLTGDVLNLSGSSQWSTYIQKWILENTHSTNIIV